MGTRFTRQLLRAVWLVMCLGMLGCPVDGLPNDGVDSTAGQGSGDVCNPNRLLCDDDDLSRCNARGTDWDVIATCAPGMCDASAGLCLPGSCGPNCGPGQACQQDADCAGSSTCDPGNKVCVEDCTGDYFVTTPEQIDAIRYCKSISGRVTIHFPAGIQESEFAEATQYLEQVRGWMNIFADETAHDLLFPKLSQVGALTFGGLVQVRMPNLITIGPGRTNFSGGAIFAASAYFRERIEFPRLERIKGDVSISAANFLRTINLPSLTAIEGSVEVYDANRLVVLGLPKLATVGSTLQLTFLHCLPYTSLSRLVSVAGNTGVERVGCCHKDRQIGMDFECDGVNLPVCTPASCN